MSSLDYSAQIFKLLKAPASNQHSISRVVSAVRQELGLPEKASVSFEFLPFVNERSPTGKLLKCNSSTSFEKKGKPKKLPQLTRFSQEKRKTAVVPIRYTGGVPGVGQYEEVPMNRYKFKSPEHQISKLSRSLSKTGKPIKIEESKFSRSKTLKKHILRLPFRAHLQGMIPLNLKNYLVHKSGLSDVICPAFPRNFMQIGQTQQDGIQDTLKDMKMLNRELKKSLFK